MIAGLRTGELDVATQIGLDLDNNPELQPLADRFNIYTIPGTKWEHIDFNLDDPVTKDIHVRRAIAYGINRKTIIDNLLFGKSEIANAFIPDWHPYYKPNAAKVVKYTFDPAKAESELKEAGYTKGSDNIYAKGGTKLKVKLQTTGATLRKQTAQLIQSDLKKVGIDVELEFLTPKIFFGQSPPGPLHGRTFQLGMYTWLASFDPDAEALYLGSHTPTKANAWGGSNFPGYKGADDLIQQADLKAENVVDEAKRIKIYGDILQKWTTDLPVFPLFLRVSPMVARKDLKNFKPTRTSAPETWNSWEWEMPAKT
jgi:peptide/nickel transport system substrate-binding protein